jgi:antitoxin component YwqK of YwqJK toxin-antitoxin module
MAMKQLFILMITLLFSAPSIGQVKDTIRERWPNGNMKNENYNIAGPGQGYMNIWYENGKPAANYHFNDGLKFSYNIDWYENGHIKEESIITGFDIVPDVDTNTGMIVREDTYLSGRFIKYYENGLKSSDGHVLLGKRAGKWSYYNEKGRLTKEEWYENGIVVSTNDRK